MSTSNSHTTGKTITWDRPMLKRFKDALSDALGQSSTTFVFDGHEFVISYAKYLIEYLESRLK